MAENFIEEVYYYSKIISGLREVIERYRFQEDYHATAQIKELIPGLENVIVKCKEQGYEHLDIIEEKLYALENIKDGISLADELERVTIPILEAWIQTWSFVDEQVDDRYKIESTSSGFLTIKDLKADRYLHSNGDPMNEARKNVENCFDYSKKSYVVWGCGMGYHAYQLYKISEGTIPITIYEPNLNLVRYALQYGVLGWIPKDNLSIKSGFNGEEFLSVIEPQDGVFLLQSYIDTMQNECQKNMLKEYVVSNIVNKKFHSCYKELKTKDISETFRLAYTISLLRQVISCCRIFDVEHMKELLVVSERCIQDFINVCDYKGFIEIEELKYSFAEIFNQHDPVLIGDLLEFSLIPIMENYMRGLDNIEKMLDERYKLESTSMGYLTIKDVSANIYLHSKNDPMDEARKVMERQYDETNSNYSVWGCGLGYHIYMLYVFSEGKSQIKVYEQNAKLVEYAYQYGVLSWIPKELLNIVYVEDADQFLNNIEGGCLFLNPYIQADNKEQRNRINEKYARFLFCFESEHNLRLNYYQNMGLGLPYVSRIDHTVLKKEIVVVGGGPSLDHYMDTLKSWQGEKTIIAAGTVWKKLLRFGIKPDYVVIMDPYEIVYQQSEDIEDTSATLLLALQANWRVGKNYKGKKYIIPHLLLIDELDEKIKNTGETLYFSGGSVTVFEAEFAIRMFPDKVYLLGVDLSLPGGMTHAEGTTYRQKLDVSEMIPMEDVNGNIVYTDHALKDSISWFELIMSETEGIEYINMSDVGVKLKGTKRYQGKPDKQ